MMPSQLGGCALLYAIWSFCLSCCRQHPAEWWYRAWDPHICFFLHGARPGMMTDMEAQCRWVGRG